MDTETFLYAVATAIGVSRNDPLSPSELACKLYEEGGELAEAVLVETGALTHKTLKEDSFGEAADVIICTLAVITKLHPDMSTDDILSTLGKSIETKAAKYNKVLEDRQNG